MQMSSRNFDTLLSPLSHVGFYSNSWVNLNSILRPIESAAVLRFRQMKGGGRGPGTVHRKALSRVTIAYCNL